MRSHAKASTAGSTQQAKGRAAIFGKALATRGSSLRANGTGAPKSGALTFLLCGVLASSLYLAGSASAAAPTISTTNASAVTTKAALLEASINPGGETTTYHFEYGPADCASNSCTSIPVPTAGIGSGSSVVKVAKEIDGLSPQTTYHFRVVATNGSGSVAAPDRTFTTYATFVPDTSCPNQAFRIGASANLPDCRAYEMVSPVNKNGGSIRERPAFFQASINGEKMAYASRTSFGDQVASYGSNEYIASRGPSGWTSRGINAPRTSNLADPFLFNTDGNTLFYGFTEDLSSAWLVDLNKTPLTPDGGPGYTNLYRRDNLTDTYEALTTAPFSGGSNPDLSESVEFYQRTSVDGFSDDGSISVFTTTHALTPNALTPTTKQHTVKQVYVSSGGELHLVSVLPDGTASPQQNQISGGYAFQTFSPHHVEDPLENAVSDDGSRVFWQARNNDGSGRKLYLRTNPTEDQSAIVGGECTEPTRACTIAVSDSVAPSGGANFEAASTDGAGVLFTVLDKLYEYDVETEATTLIASQSQGVVGAGDDLSRIYFASEEVLAAGATAGEPNLYLREEGVATFIAALSDLDFLLEPNRYYNVAGPPFLRASRVTADGRYLAFQTVANPTGYDNTDAVNGKAAIEVYHYDSEEQRLSCASCNPSGARPVGRGLPEPLDPSYNPTQETDDWGAAWIPGWEHPLHAPRVLSGDGALFFNSYDALLPQDTNGTMDVYQWMPQGARDCQRAGGCLALISTGQSAEESEFIDATPNGGSVFFTTQSSLVPEDPGSSDLYVARVGGGFPPPANPPECVGDACQSIPAAPNDPTPASASFRGTGDPAPRKARRRCRARSAHTGKNRKAKKKHAKRCRGAKRRAGR